VIIKDQLVVQWPCHWLATWVLFPGMRKSTTIVLLAALSQRDVQHVYCN
jgi:hypothetical protein